MLRCGAEAADREVPGRLRRLRVGYLSSDFGKHVMGQLLLSLYGMHSRAAVEVFCYAASAPDGVGSVVAGDVHAADGVQARRSAAASRRTATTLSTCTP
jgi:hypothetical protein